MSDNSDLHELAGETCNNSKSARQAKLKGCAMNLTIHKWSWCLLTVQGSLRMCIPCTQLFTIVQNMGNIKSSVGKSVKHE